ncbi:uncharacterized protein FFNC_15343 [Fusarium fujikuroi]|nr:uncharacterized protein FFNC_15343 [Fusarium fujikuroi]
MGPVELAIAPENFLRFHKAIFEGLNCLERLFCDSNIGVSTGPRGNAGDCTIKTATSLSLYLESTDMAPTRASMTSAKTFGGKDALDQKFMRMGIFTLLDFFACILFGSFNFRDKFSDLSNE